MKRCLTLMVIIGALLLTALNGKSETNDISSGARDAPVRYDPPAKVSVQSSQFDRAWNAMQVPDPSRIDNCVVLPERDVDVPARVDGPLAELLVEAGDAVTAGQVIGRMENRRHQAIRNAAEQRHREALHLAKCDAALREARVAAEVADLHYQSRLDANERRAGTVNNNELLNYRLEAARALHNAEKAATEHERNALVAAAREAEFVAAEIDFEDCQMTTPFDGIVVQTSAVAGEWVAAGNTVVRVVNLDVLFVQGVLSPRLLGADMLASRQVSVSFRDSNDNPASLPATVSFVSPLLHANGGRQLRVKVKNKMIDGHWILKPGMVATVHLGSADPVMPVAAAGEG